MRAFGLNSPAARAAEHLAELGRRDREEAAIEAITGEKRSRAALARMDAEDRERERAIRITFGLRIESQDLQLEKLLGSLRGREPLPIML